MIRRSRRSGAIPLLVTTLGIAGCSDGDAGDGGPQVQGDAIGVEGAHEHGVVQVGLAVDGMRLTADVRAPGDAVFGFEHTPSTDEERSAVVAALERIRIEGGSLIALPAELGCEAGGIEIVEAPEVPAAPNDHSEPEGHDDHAEHEGEHDHSEDEATPDHEEGDSHDHEAAEHSEVRFMASWACSGELEGSPATLAIAKLMPDVQLVDLTVITGLGQAGGRVAADALFRF